MPRYDFTAYDESGRVRAVIEAKGRHGTGGAWAAHFRRNLLTHGGQPYGATFVLVTPDKLYAWRADDELMAAPTLELDIRAMLEPYFNRVGVTPESIDPAAFEVLVAWWLDDLARSSADAVHGDIAGSDLLDGLRGTRIVREEAA